MAGWQGRFAGSGPGGARSPARLPPATAQAGGHGASAIATQRTGVERRAPAHGSQRARFDGKPPGQGTLSTATEGRPPARRLLTPHHSLPHSPASGACTKGLDASSSAPAVGATAVTAVPRHTHRPRGRPSPVTSIGSSLSEQSKGGLGGWCGRRAGGGRRGVREAVQRDEDGAGHGG